MRRIIEAEDIAYVVTMLASPRSIAINGDAIAAGGGTPRAIHYCRVECARCSSWLR